MWQHSDRHATHTAGMRPPAKHFGALAQPLDNILGTPSRVRVLRALDRTTMPMAIVTLARETGLAYNAVLAAVTLLTASGLVAMTPAGATMVYSLAPDHPFTPGLRQLFAVERERRRAVQATAEEWAYEQRATLHAVWLFGSVARREDTFASDVDLAVVADTHADKQRYADALRETLGPVAERLWLSPSILPYDADELVALPREDPAMWENLVRDAVVLYGKDPRSLHARLMQEREQGARQ